MALKVLQEETEKLNEGRNRESSMSCSGDCLGLVVEHGLVIVWSDPSSHLLTIFVYFPVEAFNIYQQRLQQRGTVRRNISDRLSETVKYMARNNHEETVETCIFCLIASGQDKEATVLKKNKELVCFKDIDPAAPHHYLVVPREHITNCHSLHRGHINLVKRMAEMGKKVLQDQGFTDAEEIRLGFHQPPYTSVDHLHLHVLAPSSQILKHYLYKFIPGNYDFLTDEYVIKCLKKVAPPDNGQNCCVVFLG